MIKAGRFEDLIAWQKARMLTQSICEVTRRDPFARDFGLASQIQRAAVSIMSNLAEGFDRGGRADFHRFIVTAKGSCAEVRSQLYVALDISYITEFEFKNLLMQVDEVSRIIAGLRTAVAEQRDRDRSKV
jgi:four helix bundle protein